MRTAPPPVVEAHPFRPHATYPKQMQMQTCAARHYCLGVVLSTESVCSTWSRSLVLIGALLSRAFSVDHTYKVYYGGAQKRPDGCYSRPIYAKGGKTIAAYVGDSNRKDVRNAVEVAHKAAPGWGKRASHNRWSQLVCVLFWKGDHCLFQTPPADECLLERDRP